MILFFKTASGSIIATQTEQQLTSEETKELSWLYGNADLLEAQELTGWFVGPRREMVTPWSTNAVEITQNMNIRGITRIEEYFPVSSEDADHDTMLQRMYDGLDQNIFHIDIEPAPIQYVSDLEAYNEQEGLALSVRSPTQKSSVSHKSTPSTAATRYSQGSSSSTARKWRARCLP